jgi:hypothetical protein
LTVRQIGLPHHDWREHPRGCRMFSLIMSVDLTL